MKINFILLKKNSTSELIKNNLVASVIGGKFSSLSNGEEERRSRRPIPAQRPPHSRSPRRARLSHTTTKRHETSTNV